MDVAAVASTAAVQEVETKAEEMCLGGSGFQTLVPIIAENEVPDICTYLSF